MSVYPKARCTFTPAGTIIIVYLPLNNVATDCVRIAADRCEDTAPIVQYDDSHAVRELQKLPQDERCELQLCDRHSGRLCRRALAEAVLYSPAGQHAGDDAMAAANLRGGGAGELGFGHDRELPRQ